MEREIVMPHAAAKILKTLNVGGYEAYIVGGCVRDALLGREAGDWDITTSAKPEQVKALFTHTFDTGIAHGTVTVVMEDGNNYEVTTYRTETTYSDCRHPDDVIFTASLEEDLKRRDFTMNAIAYHPKEGFRDYFGGREDIGRQVIRGVGDPSQRFQEDALRMLRALRFSVQLGFSIEKETADALKENVSLIQKISAERIRMELEKMLLGDFPEKMPFLWESGLLGALFPQWAQTLQEHGNTFIDQLSLCSRRPAVRWAAALQWIGEAGAKAVFRALKFDLATEKEALLLLRLGPSVIPAQKVFLRKLIGQIGPETAMEVLRMQSILTQQDLRNQMEMVTEILADGDCCSLRELAVDGKVLLSVGIPGGEEMGKILKKLLALVQEEPAMNEREILLEAVKRYQEGEEI